MSLNNVAAKMSIKVEIDNVCRGCLSVDRNIMPLKNNASLFFILLADQFIPKDSSYFNMFLCWECVALLRKVAEFQKQIQKSKDVFLQKWDQTKPLESLSHLTKNHNNSYDLTVVYKETDKTNPDVKLKELFNINTVIKEETSDSFDNDIDLFDKSDFTDNTNTTDKKEIKVKTKRKKAPKPVKKKVAYDVTEKDSYMTRVKLNIKELEGLGKIKKGIRDLSYRGNVLVKKMLSNKKKDVQTCDNSGSACTECSEILPNRTAMIEHWERHTVMMYKCHFCIYYGNDGDDIMTHLQQKHTTIYTCKCGVEFRSIREYFRHNNNLHKRFDCDHCKRRFKSKANIEKHMMHSHLPAKCDLCHRSYRTYKTLMGHYYLRHPELRRVKEEKPYCVECDMRFENDYLYKRHLRSAVAHKPKRDVKVPCPDCGKIFSRKTYMTNHYNLVHVRQSKHYCELCDKYFITGYAIRTHKKFVHEKLEKPKDKICEICGRGFFTNRVLTNHKRTHTGERPYMCTYCPAAFAQRSAMKTHERTQHKNYINS